MKGFYILLVEGRDNVSVTVGSLGTYSFPKGYYSYTGSALGVGSTSLEKRIRRHYRNDKAIHWHIDYLTSQSEFRIAASFYVETSERFECAVSKLLGDWGGEVIVKGFGSSDCGCKGHLTYFSSRRTVYSVLNKLKRDLSCRGVSLNSLSARDFIKF